jgi:hypothetical protein
MRALALGRRRASIVAEHEQVHCLLVDVEEALDALVVSGRARTTAAPWVV